MSNNLNHRGLVSVFVLAVCLGLAGLACGQSTTSTKPATSKPSTKSAAASSRAATTKPALRIANIRISGQVSEAPAQFSFFSDSGRSKTLRDWIGRLAAARQDAKVAAVALEWDNCSLKWSQAQELADAVRRLREVKPVYAHFSGAGISGYTVLSQATELAMEPAGELEIVGLAAEMTFYRGTLDLLGIQPQMIQIGKYKGASEPYALTQPSDEFKHELDGVFDDLFDQLVTQVAANRKLKVEAVKAAIDDGPFDAKSAREHGLVDSLVEKSQWEAHVTQAVAGKGGTREWSRNYGQEADKKMDFSNPFAFISAMFNPPTEGLTSPGVAIVYAQGVIVSGKSGEELFGGQVMGDRTMVKAINEAAGNGKVKAVVIRIDSPGGSAFASEMIYQAIRDCAARKPVIVSVSSMAASGGYYIAMGAPTIYADSTALVGSIGVVSGKMAVDGLFRKIGVSTCAFTRGKNAGLNLSRPWTPEEMATMRRMAQNVYEQFTGRVSQSRGKRIANVDDIAQGRIFTARRAKEYGMIDKIGGLREAIEAARAAGNLAPGSPILSLPRPASFAELFMGGGEEDESLQLPPQMAALLKLVDQSEATAYLLNLCRMMQTQKVLMALPYYVQVKD